MFMVKKDKLFTRNCCYSLGGWSTLGTHQNLTTTQQSKKDYMVRKKTPEI